MAGLSMQAFLDYVVDTGPVFLSDDDTIINNVSRRSFIMGKLLRGSPASKVLQGGDKIQEVLYLNAARTYQQIGRNSDINRVNPQKDVLMSLDWRFAHDQLVWDEAEYMLQAGANPTKAKYKDMNYSKQQRTWESIIDGFETGLWYPPASTPTETTTYDEMEGSNGWRWNSIPVFVNEQDGSTGGFNDGWKTIEGVNLSTYPNWRCKKSTYDATDIMDRDDDGDGLFDGLDDLSLETGYQRPGFKDEFFEPDDHYIGGKEKRSTPTILCTSKAGVKQIMRAHRLSNDSLITPQDAAYPLPKWNDIAIYDVQALDDAALYRNAADTAFVSETDATVNKPGPRYYMLNTNYLKVIFHSEKYFKMAEPIRLQNKIGMYAIDIEVWGNLLCTSLRHQGILSPA